MVLTLTSNVRYLSGVGPVKAKLLAKVGVYTIEDLLFYVPFRYNDFTLVSHIANVQPGEVVTIRGKVINIRSYTTKHGKRVQQGVVDDGTGRIGVVWFNQPYLVHALSMDREISLAGEVAWFGRKLTLTSPQYELLSEGESDTVHTGRLVPVYSETAGLTSKWLRGRMKFALPQFLPSIRDHLPDTVRTSHGLMPLPDALANVHFPKDNESAENARRRLAFDEMFLMHLTAYHKRRMRETTQEAYPVVADQMDVDRFISTLPFTLTGDQKQAVGEIITDIARPIPMHRLLVGDVGVGKTVVSAIAMFVAWKSGFGSALMAPTEILAKQHFDTVSAYLTPLGIRVGLFTASVRKQKKSDATLPLISDGVDISIGTHALLSEYVQFRNVAFVVVDEQQRFGVVQRTRLMQKGKRTKTPHILTMTATPIPRSVALTLYGNLDLSFVHEMPKGRKTVKTWVVPNAKREQAYAWIRKQLVENKTQAFIVCPFIEESETLSSVKAATTEYERLTNDVFPDLRLGLLHGRMKSREKDTVLRAFRQKKSDILVSTPVVEVGIDVKNATVMLIETAERFGLAQLHQLRGRVGRGYRESYCLLFTDADDERTLARLKALEKTHSGPELAQIDLTLRGPGDIFGTRQHGLPVLHVASFADTKLIEETRGAVATLVAIDPDLSANPDLRERVRRSTIPTVSQD